MRNFKLSKPKVINFTFAILLISLSCSDKDSGILCPGKSKILLSTTSISFSATEGSGNPASQSISITNGGDGELKGLSVSVSYSNNQSTGWLDANLSSTTAPATLSLQAKTGQLSRGTYTATVSVTSSEADNSPQSISATFLVATPPGSLLVTTSTTGTNIDQTGYVITIVPLGGGFAETTNLNVNSSILFSPLPAGNYRVELSDISQNCGVVNGSNPRTVEVTFGNRTETTFNIVCQSPQQRQLTFRNLMSSNLLNIHDIVQVKVATIRNNVFTRNDLLTPDPALCLTLPGQSIEPNQSRTFDVTLGNNYFVFIGIGIWDLNSFTCPINSQWFKRRFFTDTSFNTWYVWAVVEVTRHDPGNWLWTISGSYLNGTLVVTPAGNAGTPFTVTRTNPIP